MLQNKKEMLKGKASEQISKAKNKIEKVKNFSKNQEKKGGET